MPSPPPAARRLRTAIAVAVAALAGAAFSPAGFADGAAGAFFLHHRLGHALRAVSEPIPQQGSIRIPFVLHLSNDSGLPWSAVGLRLERYDFFKKAFVPSDATDAVALALDDTEPVWQVTYTDRPVTLGQGWSNLETGPEPDRLTLRFYNFRVRPGEEVALRLLVTDREATIWRLVETAGL